MSRGNGIFDDNCNHHVVNVALNRKQVVDKQAFNKMMIRTIAYDHLIIEESNSSRGQISFGQ